MSKNTAFNTAATGEHELFMSKTNDTSKLASRDRELPEDELDGVTGGVVIALIAILIG